MTRQNCDDRAESGYRVEIGVGRSIVIPFLGNIGSRKMKKVINTKKAPQAIGTYSQAVKVENTVYLSGQIPLHPETMELITGNFPEQVKQIFENLKAVAEAAGGDLNDLVKLNIFLLDMKNFPIINEVMAQYCAEPYPARAVICVSALPKNAEVEIDGVMVLSPPPCKI